MRKLLAIVISTAMIVSIPAAFSATPKVGGSCTKINQFHESKSTLLVCAAVKGKKTWRKATSLETSLYLKAKAAAAKAAAERATKAVPTPTATKEDAPFVAWSSNTSAKAVSDAAQASFRNWAALQNGKAYSHKLDMQQSVPGDRKNNFQRTDALGARLFAQFISGGSVTVIGSNETWVVEKLNDNGGRYKNCSDSAGNPGLNYCLDLWKTQGYVVTSDMGFDAINPGNDGSGLLAHEYFHIVQSQLANLEGQRVIRDGNQESENLFPAWLIEGGANFVGFSVTALALGGTYWEGRKAMFTYAPPGEAINSHSLEDYEIRNGPGNYSPTYPYITGQAATEYLVASAGFEKFLNIFLSFRETKDFKKSFEKIIGISIGDFYKRFEAVRTVLGLPVVSHKLVCLTSYKLTEVPVNVPPCALATNSSNAGDRPPGQGPNPIDRTSDVDGLGCRYNEPDLINSYGRFVCTVLPDQNNRWQKQP